MRERIAWCGFAFSSVALAAALASRTDFPAPAPTRGPPAATDERLARIDARLAHIESSLRAGGLSVAAIWDDNGYCTYLFVNQSSAAEPKGR